MALKASVTATEFAALADVLKTEYKLGSDGVYRIDLGGMFVTDKDPQGLLSALDNERKQHADTKSKFDAIVKERDDARQAEALAKAQKEGNYKEIEQLFTAKVAAIEDSYKKQVAEAEERTKKQQAAVAENLRKTEAMKIARELFDTKAELLLPHVLAGLQVVPGDDPKIQIVKSDGTTDLSMDLTGYKNSFLTNPTFKDMIVASKASGGSANEGTGKNVPANRKPDGSARTYDDYKPGELMALKQSNPELFSQLKIAKFGQTS